MNGFLNQGRKEKAKKPDTAPTTTDVKSAEAEGIDLAKSWRPYSREVRLHIYVDNIQEMTRFYNKILEFPVVRFWRDSSGDGSMINVGGNIIELFSKRGAERHYNKQYFGNCSLSVRVKDVRKLHDKFSRKNIKIGVLEQMEWGDTNFELVDPEGNRIYFFTPDLPHSRYYKVKANS